MGRQLFGNNVNFCPVQMKIDRSMSTTETKDGIPAVYAASPQEWRAWLAANHDSESKVWLIMYAKGSGMPSLTWSEAVDEALCFGWIDSKSNKRDEQSRYLYFCPRKPKSAWSKINKAKIERLIAAGKMAPAGMRVVEVAQANGTWNVLDEIEEDVMPEDLVRAFAKQPAALATFQGFPPGGRKAIYQWVISAKRPETRAQRVETVVSEAAAGRRANQWKPK